MKISLIMKDKNGVRACIGAESHNGWDALELEGMAAARLFEPVEYCEITIFRDDGSMYWHGLSFFSFSKD